MNKYNFKIFFSEPDSEWVATCEEHVFLSSIEDSPTEALVNLIEILKEIEDERTT